MCGIFGAIKLKGSFSEENYREFVRLTNVIHYRGEDASGCREIDTFTKAQDKTSFNVFLGHRRLSIIDLSENGTQPMVDGHLSITFNGEIFNYLELREELIKKGYTFKTDTDTEVILKTYLEYGEKGFAEFNGMWALILVDLHKNKAVISRDRFSIKPLYYYRDSDAMYFGSEIKQLLPLQKQRSVNRDNLYAFLQQALLDHNNETFFEGISKVKPKHNVIIKLDTGEVSEEQYWEYARDEARSADRSEERFRELLYDSVKIRLRSDVKIGSLLSGGLDSSAITVIADKINKGNFESFSVVSKEKKYSEESFIDLLVKKKGLVNQKFLFEPEMVPAHIDEVLYHQDEPFGSFSIIAQYLIFKQIKSSTDITVVLSGQGGDEALMGYNKYFFFYLKQLQREGKYGQAMSQAFGSLLHRTTLWNIKLGYTRRYIPFLMRKRPDYLHLSKDLEKVWEFRDMEQRQKLDIDRYSVPALAHYEDRNAMAFGLEVRHPFLDHRLIDFSLSLEPGQKMKNGWSKYMLRHSIHELPPEISWRRDKKGFITPDEKWLKEDLQPLLFKSMQNSILHEMGILDKHKFIAHYKDFLKPGSSIYFNDIFRVFIAELWAQKNFSKQ